MAADGGGAVEILRVAAEKASAELKAEQAARRQDEGKISMMALELKNATSRCELLEKENEAKTAELDKAL